VFSKINNVKTKSRNILITDTVEKSLLSSEGIKAQGGCPTFKQTEDMLSRMASANLYKGRSGPVPDGTPGTSKDICDIDEDSDIFF
jgi:hypothetical protein